jgi:Cu+-exporting ATPase
VESHSEHPIATAIVEAARGAGGLPEVTGFASAAGGGVHGTVHDVGSRASAPGITAGGGTTGTPPDDGRPRAHAVAAGRSSYISTQLDAGALTDPESEALAAAEGAGATAIWVAVDGRIAGIVSLQDTIKESSAQAVADLKALGLRPILLTGDNAQVAARVAAAVGIPGQDVFAGVRPEDKVAKVTELQQAGRVVAMVGDGVNDAPALAQADLGIAMGSGTDVAREAADITVMGSSLHQVVQSVRLSRKTLGIIKSNLFWAFAYNTLGIPVAAIGLLNPMLAGAAMAASSVLVVANSLRLTRFAR